MPIQSARVHRSRSVDDPGTTQSQRLPTAGTIRAGIKVLTQAAAKIAGATDIYRRGVEAGVSFDDIARELGKLPGIPKTPLTPRNVPYFTARPGDFRNPAHAKLLMDLYGETRDGDPVRRLYGFPIVLPSDDIDLFFPEQFEAWSASELHRWSQQNPNTGFLDCMRRDPVPPKAGRRFGGRPIVKDRDCDPNDCKLFAAGQCKHQGALYFWIPGIPSAELFTLSFTSVYAPLQIGPTLDLVRGGLGRVSGLYNGEPMFRLQKEHQRVAAINPDTGKPEKQAQWIITMAATIDMMSVLRRAEQPALPPPAADHVTALPAPANDALEPVQTVESDAGPDERAALVARMNNAISDIGWTDRARVAQWVETHHSGVVWRDDLHKLNTVVPQLEAIARGLAKLRMILAERPALSDAWDEWMHAEFGGADLVFDPSLLPQIIEQAEAVTPEGKPQ